MSTMYRIKPLSAVPDTIELPKCMYHIKPLAKMSLESVSDSLVPGKRIKMEPELQAIEDRQLAAISRLRQLRDKVDDMIKKAGGPNLNQGQQQRGGGPEPKSGAINTASLTSNTSSTAAIENVILPSELVVEANPERPPFSLLFFQQLNPSLRVVTHTHSSCDQSVDQKLQSLFSREPSNISGTVRIVWKKLPDSRLTPPCLGSCGVEGESNVARYLSRVLCPSNNTLNYDAVPIEDLILVDEVLASSDRVEASPDNFLSALQAYIQRSSGGGANNRTVADFVGYSTLRYLTQQQPKRSIQKPLVDWMNSLTNNVLC